MNKRPGIPRQMIGALYVDLEAAGFGRQDILAMIGALVHVWGDDIAQWQEIESAARAVLDHGQARYEAEEVYVGDLVPAEVLIALGEAVHGAKLDTERPPAASDVYARELEAALFGTPAESAAALPPRAECPDCDSPTGMRGMCDRHFDALVDMLRRA